MSELVFCKLGGSIITDKRRASTARPEVIERLAQEIARVLDTRPGLQLLLGHGSGSFGHVVAAKYGVHKGIADGKSWWGFAETGAVAARLNRLVTDAFIRVGVPVVSVQPSASARCRGGALIALDTYPIQEALRHRLVPLVHGDVAFDSERGCTIVSTEAEFAYLAHELRPARIVLVGEVHGVYDRDPLVTDDARRFPRISPKTYAQIEAGLGGSPAADVTGGMSTKVGDMVCLVEGGFVQRVHLISGHVHGALARVLLDPSVNEGTVIENERRRPAPDC